MTDTETPDPALALRVGALRESRLVRTCSIWRALDVIGDLPTLLVLESIWLQSHRFGQIQMRTQLPKAMVSNRLNKLVTAGIVLKRPYLGDSARFDYLLTDIGLDLYWVTLMLHRWERRWSNSKKAFEVTLTHLACGATTLPTPVCGHCLNEFSASDVTWEPGPGIGLMQPQYTRRRLRRELASASDNALLFTDSAELLGDRWMALILRAMFTGLTRYDDIVADTAMATNILSERLTWLIDFGVIETESRKGNALRKTYHLTEKGRDFLPVLVMLQAWGDRHYAAPEGPPVVLRHQACGKILDPAVSCSE
ncbi:MAG: helix-turn-helix domain-containing protein, partial [Pseudomonadota bacterium]